MNTIMTKAEPDNNVIGYKLEWRSKDGRAVSEFFKPDKVDQAIKQERKLIADGMDYVYLSCIWREPVGEEDGEN